MIPLLFGFFGTCRLLPFHTIVGATSTRRRPHIRLSVLFAFQFAAFQSALFSALTFDPHLLFLLFAWFLFSLRIFISFSSSRIAFEPIPIHTSSWHLRRVYRYIPIYPLSMPLVSSTHPSISRFCIPIHLLALSDIHRHPHAQLSVTYPSYRTCIYLCTHPITPCIGRVF
jgi:hypothetical protein